jgi:hypothetical protein
MSSPRPSAPWRASRTRRYERQHSQPAGHGATRRLWAIRRCTPPMVYRLSSTRFVLICAQNTHHRGLHSPSAQSQKHGTRWKEHDAPPDLGDPPWRRIFRVNLVERRPNQQPSDDFGLPKYMYLCIAYNSLRPLATALQRLAAGMMTAWRCCTRVARSAAAAYFGWPTARTPAGPDRDG